VFKRKYFKNIAWIILFTLAFIASFILGYFIASISGIFVENVQVESEGVEYEVKNIDKDKTTNVLLLGYGGEGHPGGYLTDVIMVANINPEDKKITLISIPRDTLVPLPIRSDLTQELKVNNAYAVGFDDSLYPLKEPKYKGEAGAGAMAKYAAEYVVGMPIHHFVSVSFDGFRKSIDVLGGVNVDVPVTFDDYFYPVKGLENETCGYSFDEIVKFHEKYSGFELEKQFQCRYEHLHFDAGENYMDGETALKFVRSRHSSQHGGDFARSQRQFALINGIKEKALSLGALDDLPGFYEKFTDSVRTDADIETLIDLAQAYEDIENWEVGQIRLTEDNVFDASRGNGGQFILVPKKNWSAVHEFVEEKLGEFRKDK
jgi:anionic cell wall polymer biosynthesis LytR-Cps2A-Psr (LCP) family protein